MVMQVPGFTPPPSLAAELSGKSGKSAREQLDAYGTPGYKRLQIPLVDAGSLGTAAEILSDLAYQLRLQSRAPTGREIDSLRAAFWEIDAANRRLSAIQKIRKATKSSVSE